MLWITNPDWVDWQIQESAIFFQDSSTFNTTIFNVSTLKGEGFLKMHTCATSTMAIVYNYLTLNNLNTKWCINSAEQWQAPVTLCWISSIGKNNICIEFVYNYATWEIIFIFNVYTKGNLIQQIWTNYSGGEKYILENLSWEFWTFSICVVHCFINSIFYFHTLFFFFF